MFNVAESDSICIPMPYIIHCSYGQWIQDRQILYEKKTSSKIIFRNWNFQIFLNTRRVLNFYLKKIKNKNLSIIYLCVCGSVFFCKSLHTPLLFTQKHYSFAITVFLYFLIYFLSVFDIYNDFGVCTEDVNYRTIKHVTRMYFFNHLYTHTIYDILSFLLSFLGSFCYFSF